MTKIYFYLSIELVTLIQEARVGIDKLERDAASNPNFLSLSEVTMKRRNLASISGLMCMLLLGGCQHEPSPASAPAAPAAPAEVELDGGTYRVQGPISHDNVAVFLISSNHQDERDFLTLDEGLTSGLVKISELEDERVRSLQIENTSDRPLYLQEGERLRGGKQDRTMMASLIVPAKSGKASVPTFCVEHHRWTEGEKGKQFGFTVNPALAPKGVRGAAKIEGSQDAVWTCVEVQKGTAAAKLKTKNTTSSVNEMLDSAEVRAISEEYARTLVSALDAPDNGDLVGVVIVVNGQIEEANIYPNRALFGKMFPRLIQSYALQAAMLKDQLPAAGTELNAVAAAQFLKGNVKKTQPDKKIDARNVAQVRELEDNRFVCTTHYDGQLVHWQLMKKNGSGENKEATARRGILGGHW
jgi:hypothetical protein